MDADALITQAAIEAVAEMYGTPAFDNPDAELQRLTAILRNALQEEWERAANDLNAQEPTS